MGAVGPKRSETTILHLGDTWWMVAVGKAAMHPLICEDEGVTWGGPNRVAESDFNDDRAIHRDVAEW